MSQKTATHSNDNPFESMMSRFDEAARILGLDEGSYNVLKSPQKSVIVSIPVTMDNGTVQVFAQRKPWPIKRWYPL
jgi:glutamate dehydrogenase (NAD(P)+)